MKKILYSVFIYFGDNHHIRVEWESKEKLIGEITDNTSIATILDKMPGIKKEVAELLYMYGDEKQILTDLPLSRINKLVLSEKSLNTYTYSKWFDDTVYSMLITLKEGIEISYQFDNDLKKEYMSKYASVYAEEDPYMSYMIYKLFILSNDNLKIKFVHNIIDELIRIIGLDNIKNYDNIPNDDVKQILRKIYLKIKNLLIHLLTKINVIYENQERFYAPVTNATSLYELLVTAKKELKQAEGVLLVNDDAVLLVKAKDENDDILSQLVRVDYKKEAKEFIESLDKYYDVSNTVKFSKKRLGAIALSLYICRYFNHNHSFTEFQKLVCQYFDKEEISYKPNKVFDEFNKIMNDFPYNDFKADKEQYKRFFP